MPITNEQRARVQKRAQELIAQGLPTVDAVDKAFTEEVGAEGLPTALEEKGTATPEVKAALAASRAPLPQNLPREVAKREVAAKSDVLGAEKGLAGSKQIVTTEKARQLSETGLPGVVAQEKAATTFEEMFGVPMGKNYAGTVAEKRAGGIVPEGGLPLDLTNTATLREALRPRTYLPDVQVEAEKKKTEATKQDFTWGDVYKSIKEQKPDLTEDAVNDELFALKTAYDVVRVKNPNSTSKEIFEMVNKELGSISGAISNKTKWKKEPTAQMTGLMTDPLYAAFQKQTKAGEGFPDLSPVQIAYLTTQKNKKVDRRYAQLKAEYANKDITVSDEVPGPGGSTRIEKKTLSGSEKDTALRQMAENEVALPFWADQEKLEKRLADPNKFNWGLLSQTNPYGTTRETNMGWLLRSAMIVPNVTAGAIAPLLFEGSALAPETREDIAAEKRVRRPKAYKDSPILLNVAEGRGFIGEAIETADIMGLREVDVPVFGNAANVYLAGAFAADLLDPSLDIVSGASKGARVATQTYKGMKAAGLVPDVQKALSRGVSEGVKEAASTSPLLGVPFSKKSLQPGDLRHFVAEQITREIDVANDARKAIEAGAPVQFAPGKEKTQFAKRWASTPGATDAEKLEAIVADAKYLDSAIEDIKKFDNFLAGSGVPTSSRDVLRSLGEVAVADPAIATKVRQAIKTGQGVGATELLRLVRSDADVANAVKRQIVERKTLQEVYSATADVDAFDDYVRVTRNTWASPVEADRLLNQFRKGDFGQLLQELRDKPTVYGKSGRRATFIGAPQRLQDVPYITRETSSGVELTRAEAAEVQDAIDRLKAVGKLQITDFPFVPGRGSRRPELAADVAIDDFISYKDLRKLIDADIDQLAATSKNAVGAAEVSRLQPRQALATTIPVEARSFNHQTFLSIYDKMTSIAGVNKPANLRLNASQRAAINDVTSKLSKIDQKLRNDIRKVMGDLNFREALTGSKNEISRSEALAYLTFPKDADINIIDIEKILNDMSKSMLTTAGYREDIFDIFSGINLERSTDIWSETGRSLVDNLVTDAARNVQNAPATLWSEMRELHDNLVRLTADAKNLKNPNDKIIDIVKNSDVLRWELPQEVLVGTYYRAEAKRAIDDTIKSIVEQNDIEQLFTRISDDALVALGSGAEQKLKDMIVARLETFVSDPNILKSSTTVDNNVLRAFGVDEADPQLSLFGPKPQVTPEVLALVDDFAKQIFDANGLRSADNISDRVSDIRKALNSPDVYERAKLVLGEDIAKQMKAAFAESGAATVESNIADALRKYADESGLDKSTRLVSSALSAVTDLFYTAVLNLSPRFHAGNWFGAPGLIYGTTGRFVDPETLNQAINVATKAGTARGGDFENGVLQTGIFKNKAAEAVPDGTWASRVGKRLSKPFTADDVSIRTLSVLDAAGRKYTPDELWEAFSTRAGASTQELGLADVRSTAVARELSEGIAGPAERAYQSFKDFPTTSDTIWRMTVGIDALKEGRSLDDAVELARRAMYDTGDITSAEKKIQAATLFYSFARNNLVNLLKNMTDPLFFKRIVKIGATKRGAEGLILNSTENDMSQQELKELRAFAPTSTDTRIIMGLAKPVDGKPVYIAAGPSDSTLSALDLFGNLLAGRYAEQLTGMLRPETKALLNLDETRDMEEIPTEQLYAISLVAAATGQQTGDLVSALVTPTSKWLRGELDYVKPIKKEDGTLTYKLVDPIQQKTYTDRIAVLNYLGLMRIVGELPNMLGEPGMKVTKSGVDNVLYTLNLNTPLKGQSPMMQRAKNVILLDKEAASWARDLSNKAIEDVKTALPATAAEKTEQDIRFAKTEAKVQKKAEKVLTLDAVKAEMLAKQSELNSLPKRVRDGEITKTQALLRRDQIKTELADLKVKKAALQAGETPK
jgi:hypothetical protein